MTHTQNNAGSDECCVAFDAAKWDIKTHTWDRVFIRESVPAFLHMPLVPLMGKKITRMMKMAEDAGKMPSTKAESLLLFTDPTPFRSEMYLSVNDDVPGADNVRFSGTYMSRVFDGPYNAVPKFMKQMDASLAEDSKKATKYYVHYAYCPKCAKDKGGNPMILFAKV